MVGDRLSLKKCKSLQCRMGRVPEDKSYQGTGSPVRKGYNGAFRPTGSILMKRDNRMVAFPGFDRVYLLQDPLSTSAYRGRFDTSIDPLAITRGEVTPETPILIRWDMGGESPSDIVWTTSAHPLIAHRRVLDLFCEKNLTGWRSYPVQVLDKLGTVHDDYAGLQIVGRCGVVDLSRSTVALKHYPGGWFPQLVGYFFDENSWDGSALFMHVPDRNGRVSAHILMTEPVREILSKAQIRNVGYQRLSDLSVVVSTYRISQADLPHNLEERINAVYEQEGIPRPRQRNRQ